MIKNIVLLAALLLFFTCKQEDDTPPIVDTGSKPNILLIIADDLGIDGTPDYTIGNIKPNMPNLQTLVSTGITFDNVWAYPVCSPTRASILTGRYGYRTGVLNAESAAAIPITEKSIQTYLDENTNSTYSHSVIGKWHLSVNPHNPTQMGIGYYAGYLKGSLLDYNNWALTENGQSNDFEGYCTTKITDLAIDWINVQTKPWFCWLAYTAPHTPFHLPPVNMHTQGSLPTDQASIDDDPMPYYMAMIESVDFEIGRLFDNIPTSELENTIIIFIGDNGTHRKVLQAPYQPHQGKGTLYQGGLHVPMVISGKGVSRVGERDENLISSTDIFASIAEIAGVTLSRYEDSYSFKSLLTSSNIGSRQYNYAEILNDQASKSGYAIRNTQYKLIQFDDGSQEFYDLSVDKYEGNNLLLGTMSTAQNLALEDLIAKAEEVRN